jgi:stage II sporulation protein GA (sporulation sigma-E factor processing peptidase)
MDFIVLFITNRACGYAATYLRLLLSTTFGALWAVLVLISEGCVKNIFHICSYLLVSYICVWIISGTNQIRINIRGTAVMYAVTFILAGALKMLMNSGIGGVLGVRILSRPAVGVTVILSVILVKICLKALTERLRVRELTAMAEISVGGQTFTLNAIIDTGNCLTDPYSAKPVCVAEKAALPDNLYIGSDELLHYIPISSVGCENGVIQVFTAGKCRIYNKELDLELNDVLIGISENRLSRDAGFEMLINPVLLSGRM